MTEHIFHIASAADWRRAAGSPSYMPPAFESDGFVHCSTRSQVIDVANAYFGGARDLLLLRIDPRRLSADLRFESGDDGVLYPHVYGPLNLDAVVAVLDFPTLPNGGFALPAQLEA